MIDIKVYDVVVVGAGPSGSTAAYYIDKLNVLIIDKFNFPRFKACGGILSCGNMPELFGNYAKINKKLKKYTTRSALFYFDTHFAFKKTYDFLFHHIERDEFDNLLLKEALKKKNVKFRKFNLKEIKKKDNIFVLSDGKNQIQAKYIIGADGWDSVVSSFLGNERRTMEDYGLCLEYDIECKKKTMDNHVFYFYKEEMGYAWIFPTHTGYYIGLGDVGKTEKPLKTYLEEFVKYSEHHNLIPKKFKIKKMFGAPDPINIVDNYSTDKAILCGDALGTVNQTTGEGIFYAMCSGKIAGQIIDESTNDISKRYKKSIEPVIEEVTFLRKMPSKKTALIIFKYLYKLSVSSLWPEFVKDKIRDWFIEHTLKRTKLPKFRHHKKINKF